MNIEKEPQFDKEQEAVEILKLKIERLTQENERLKKELEEALERLTHDDLTGLENRKFFTEKSRQNVQGIISSEKEKRKEGFESISFLFCDIDDFKDVNDFYNHDFGDEILIEVTAILKKNVRESDAVCRWGGEEIVISLLGADENEAAAKAEQLRRAVEEMIAKKYKDDPRYSKLKVTLSIGVSSFQPGLNFEQLVKQADKAMYMAKEEGRNRVRTYSQVSEKQAVKEDKSSSSPSTNARVGEEG